MVGKSVFLIVQEAIAQFYRCHHDVKRFGKSPVEKGVTVTMEEIYGGVI